MLSTGGGERERGREWGWLTLSLLSHIHAPPWALGGSQAGSAPADPGPESRSSPWKFRMGSPTPQSFIPQPHSRDRQGLAQRGCLVSGYETDALGRGTGSWVAAAAGPQGNFWTLTFPAALTLAASLAASAGFHPPIAHWATGHSDEARPSIHPLFCVGFLPREPQNEAGT